MRISGTIQDSIVDGPGLRFVIFTQGCPHHCPGCHNPETHDPDGGKEMSQDELIKLMSSNPLTDGLTLSGGEPFMQASELIPVAKAAREKGFNIWAWSGWTIDELLASGDEAKIELLKLCDVLVDGRFVLAKRSLALEWRGSSNQRVLDVKKSIAAGEGVWYSPPSSILDAFTIPKS